MNRRDFMRIGMIGAGTVGAANSGQAMAAVGSLPKGAFKIADASVAELQTAMQSGKVTSKALVKAYLARIKAIDKSGPAINSIIELNPDALAIADALDKERKAKGPRGPLHGIPVLIKDNIATADKMQTTAGSLALVGIKPQRDAFIVEKLRAAGAVIIGKTNLSEWANFRSTRSSSGWSGRGGLSKNPYALDRSTSGSSAGSGASIAASLAAVAVGTETDGSIISPSSANCLVGIKPTLGLVSRSGIIPIAASHDTAGPMARSVADAAILLSALIGADPRDDITKDANRRAQDYTSFLDADGLRGARIGVVRANFGGRNDLSSAVVETALTVLTAKGAILVDIEIPNATKYGPAEREVLTYELKAGLNAYLAECVPGAPIRTLRDLIAFNEQNRDREMKYFGQEILEAAETTSGNLSDATYVQSRALCLQLARSQGIDAALERDDLDAIVAPGGSYATSPAAVAGYPSLSLPVGLTAAGTPAAIWFYGGFLKEPTLLAFGFALEQALKAYRAPQFGGFIPAEPPDAGLCGASMAAGASMTARATLLNKIEI